MFSTVTDAIPIEFTMQNLSLPRTVGIRIAQVGPGLNGTLYNTCLLNKLMQTHLTFADRHYDVTGASQFEFGSVSTRDRYTAVDGCHAGHVRNRSVQLGHGSQAI